MEEQSEGMKQCPDCAELVKAEATRCRYCGAHLKRSRMFKGNILLIALLGVVALTLAAVVVIVTWTGISTSNHISEEEEHRDYALGQLQYPTMPAAQMLTYEEWKNKNASQRAEATGSSAYDSFLEGTIYASKKELTIKSNATSAVYEQMNRYMVTGVITLTVGFAFVCLVLCILILMLVKTGLLERPSRG